MRIDVGLDRSECEAGWSRVREKASRARIVSRALALATSALALAVAGCSYMTERPEINPDRYAPPSVEREWQPPSASVSVRSIPTVASLEMQPAQMARPSQPYDMWELIDL